MGWVRPLFVPPSRTLPGKMKGGLGLCSWGLGAAQLNGATLWEEGMPVGHTASVWGPAPPPLASAPPTLLLSGPPPMQAVQPPSAWPECLCEIHLTQSPAYTTDLGTLSPGRVPFQAMATMQGTEPGHYSTQGARLYPLGSGPQGSGVCENYPRQIIRKLHFQPWLGFRRTPRAR